MNFIINYLAEKTAETVVDKSVEKLTNSSASNKENSLAGQFVDCVSDKVVEIAVKRASNAVHSEVSNIFDNFLKK